MAEQKKIKISQKDNYQGNFGFVNRSSGIFYYKKTPEFSSTICFMDYWSVKRDVKVLVLASTRDMNGRLIKREQLNFEKANVLNYQPDLGLDSFEGSVEIEVFATQNMVIPYSAIMVIYEAENSISMVHTYGRIYSHHEVEEGRTITIGRESCCTIKDDNSKRSFVVFHNGHKTQPTQQVKVAVTNAKGDITEKSFQLDSIPAYGTVKMYISDYIDNLESFLDGKPGNASLSFELTDAFTRMIIGNETKNGKELQVTHSNFNYSEHESDQIEDFNESYMNIIPANFSEPKVIIYPDAAKGEYQVVTKAGTTKFTNKDRTEVSVEPGETITFKPFNDNVKMPTRIVTAFTGKSEKNNSELAFECSLGVKHKEVPPKSSHWGVITSNNEYIGKLYAVPAKEIFGEVPEDIKFSLAIYNAINKQVESKDLSFEEVQKLSQGLEITELFEDAKNFFGEKFGYFYLRSTYPGFTCYSTLESTSGSITLEHAF